MHKRKTLRGTCRHADIDCADCLAARRCWGAPLEERSGIHARREGLLPKGTLLLRQGEPFGAIHIVVRGCLCLRETMLDGAERIVGFRVRGELVGIEGWARGHCTYTAEAAETTMTCRLSWPGASGKAAGSNALLQRLLAKTAIQLDRSSTPWSGLPAVERVAAFVEDFVRRARADHATREHVTLPMTRAQLGSYLGLAEETIVRALAQLRLRKRLDIQGRSVSLPLRPPVPG